MLMVTDMTEIQMDRTYPMIVAMRALLMKTWKKNAREICDSPHPTKSRI
jgi:hypothetical protein